MLHRFTGFGADLHLDPTFELWYQAAVRASSDLGRESSPQGGMHVAETIIDTAQKEGVGLIVMTTQGSGGLVRWLMGSTAERVVRHAPCPVLTIGRKTLERGLLD